MNFHQIICREARTGIYSMIECIPMICYRVLHCQHQSKKSHFHFIVSAIAYTIYRTDGALVTANASYLQHRQYRVALGWDFFLLNLRSTGILQEQLGNPSVSIRAATLLLSGTRVVQ